VGLDDELLVRHSHFVVPAGQSRLTCYVLEYPWPGFDKPSSGDGSSLGVVDGGCQPAGGDPSSCAAGLRLSWLLLRLARTSSHSTNALNQQEARNGSNPKLESARRR